MQLRLLFIAALYLFCAFGLQAKFVEITSTEAGTRFVFSTSKKTSVKAALNEQDLSIAFSSKQPIIKAEFNLFLPSTIKLKKISHDENSQIELHLEKPATFTQSNIDNKTVIDVTWQNSQGAAVEIPRSVIKISKNNYGSYTIKPFPDDKIAAFERLGYLWLVLPSEFDVQNSSGDNKIKIYTNPNHSIVQWKIPEDTSSEFIPSKDSVLVSFTRDIFSDNNSVKHRVISSATGKIFSIDTLPTGNPIEFTLPGQGINLVAVPGKLKPRSINNSMEFVDFRILPSVYGLVIMPLSSDIVTTADQESVKISSIHNLAISDDKDIRISRVAFIPKPYLDFSKWGGDKSDSLAKQNRRFTAIFDAPMNKRSPLRIEYAKHLLLAGREVEATAIVEWESTHDQTVLEMPYVHYFKAVSAFMANNYIQAYRNLNALKAEGDPELEMWEGITLLAANRPFDMSKILEGMHYVTNYPPVMRNKIILLLAEKQADLKLPIDKTLNALSKKDLTTKQQKNIQLISARAAMNSSQNTQAIETLKFLSADKFEEYGVKAGYYLTLQLTKNKAISPADEIKRLEDLRYKWQGGELEYNILKRLTKLYVESAIYDKALRNYRIMLNIFPNRSRRDNLNQVAQNVFQLAMEDAKNVQPLAQYAIFREYQNFMPDGEVAEEIRAKLADLLISIDLLPEAAKILQGYLRDMKGRLTSEEEAKKIIQLAVVFLVDNKPKDVIQTLSDAPEYNLDFSHEKKMLMAQAFLMNQQYEETLGIISEDNTQQANMLRMKIYSEQNNMQGYVRAIDSLLAQTENNFDADLILRKAVALFNMNDQVGLEVLREKYSKKMQAEPQGHAFLLIISPQSASSTHSSDVLRNVKDSESFVSSLDKYREQLKTKGISSIG